MFKCEPDQLKENICKAFTAGYFYQMAKKKNEHVFEKLCSSGEKKDVFLHPHSSLFKQKPLPEYILFHDVMETLKAYVMGVCGIKPQWVEEYAPEFFCKIKEKYSFTK